MEDKGTRRARVAVLAVAAVLALVFGGAAVANASDGGIAVSDASSAPSEANVAVASGGASPFAASGPLYQAASALAGGEPEQSAGGSVVGILIDNTPEQGADPDAPDVSDSYLGILLAPGAGQLLCVSYMLTDGVEYTSDKVAPGWLASKPATDPVWPASRPWPDGFSGEPTFNGWCTDVAGTVPYDFATPVMADLVLWASWADGGRDMVTVTLDAGADGTVADPNNPGANPGRTLALTLRAGSAYPELPTPVRTGYEFVGWFDAELGGSQIYPTPAGVEAARVSEADCTLWAHWTPRTYWVHYVIDEGANVSYDQKVPYDENGAATFMTWDALAQLGYVAPQNKKLLGWHTDPAGDDAKGTFYAAGSAVPDLAQAASTGSLDVYAQWQGEHGDEEFVVTFRPELGVFADGSSADKVMEDVTLGTVIDAFDDPKRTGYQFAGWWLRANDEPTGAPVREWSFAEAVHSDLVLFARWDLRLDVTVPVSLGFAVDATTGAAIGPDAEHYAIKSRTVEPVGVESFELVSQRAELEAFFEAAEGEDWEEGVRETQLSLKSERADASLALALAGDRRALGPAAPDYALGAFSYSGITEDSTWEGADPSERLPIAFGLDVSRKLQVKVGQPGAVPIARLKVTVSARL